MAGSFCHILDESGEFRGDLIENLGDAYEALEECFILIYALSDGKIEKVSELCKKLNFPDPINLEEDGKIPRFKIPNGYLKKLK